MKQYPVDILARKLATSRDRRTLLSASVATAALVLDGLFRHAQAQAGCPTGCAEGEICTEGLCITPCTNNRECRSKHDDPCVSNICLRGACVSAVIECLAGNECCDGECCPKSCEFDLDCAVLDPCLWGRCGVSGQCEFTQSDPCIVCSSDKDCVGSGQNTICCDGACHRPCPDGTLMGKGCECRATGSAALDGLVVVDDASG